MSGPAGQSNRQWPAAFALRTRALVALLLAAVVPTVLTGAAMLVGAAVPVITPEPSGHSDLALAPIAAPDPGPQAPSPGASLIGRAATGPGAGPRVGYGLAEPAGALPGAATAADEAAWSQIRTDIAASGACWLRTDLSQRLGRAIETYPWLGSPAACGPAGGAAVKVLAILDDHTVWVGRRLCPETSFSASYKPQRSEFGLDDWQQLAACIAARFRGRISAYEIWNEPLLPGSMLGYQDGTAARYADLLRVAHAAIKSADPDALVLALGGSDLFAGGDQERLDRMRAFTTQLVALGAARTADAISLHAYPWGRGDAAVLASYAAELSFHAQAWGKPVWITETGTRATDAGTQSGYAQAAYRLFDSAGVDHIFWFSITDQPDGAFGLRGRPVASTLRELATAGP